MEKSDVIQHLLTATPVTLALLLGVSAVGVVGLALVVILRITEKKGGRE